jgi:heat shock protein HtpX
VTRTATLAGAISMLTNFGFYFGGGRNNDKSVGAIGGLLLITWGRSPRALCR